MSRMRQDGSWVAGEGVTKVSCYHRVKTKVVGCATKPIEAWAHQIEI